jgi:hypothetical protein
VRKASLYSTGENNISKLFKKVFEPRFLFSGRKTFHSININNQAMKNYLVLFLLFFLTQTASAQITLDGNASESQYATIATGNANNGFGGTNNIYRIRFFADGTTLYLGIPSNLDDGNRITLLINFSGYTGIAAGNNIGGSITGGGGFGLSGNNNTDVRIGMESDYGLDITRSSGEIFVDAYRFGVIPSDNYFVRTFVAGNANLTGTPVTGPAANVANLFDASSVSFAYNNSNTGGGSDQRGFEIAIPLAQFKGGITGANTANFFALIGNNNNPTFFSNEAVPGIPSGTNLGTNPGFITGSGGTTPDSPLPVNVSNFGAVRSAGSVMLSWVGENEIDNAGFVMMRNGVRIADFQTMPNLRGRGTAPFPKTYLFADGNVSVGEQYTYRLMSMDLSGIIHDHGTTVVTVTEASLPIAPKNFSLKNNYPNPFNPTTVIQYDLAATSNVKLEVFDMMGRNVATLVNASQPAGSYSVSFNTAGLQVSSGVYFYQLSAGAYRKTNKMLLVK